MDGRDVPPDSGIRFIGELQSKLTELKCGRIATVMGRYYAMDRDNRYERVEKRITPSFTEKACTRPRPAKP